MRHHLQVWGGIERTSGKFVVHVLPVALSQKGAVGPPESLDRVVATGAVQNFKPRCVTLIADGARMYPNFAALIRARKLLQCNHGRGIFNKEVGNVWVNTARIDNLWKQLKNNLQKNMVTKKNGDFNPKIAERIAAWAWRYSNENMSAEQQLLSMK